MIYLLRNGLYLPDSILKNACHLGFLALNERFSLFKSHLPRSQVSWLLPGTALQEKNSRKMPSGLSKPLCRAHSL